ncbi:MAG TPA: hypothetical protein VF156_15580 [Agromyces sp.]
MIRSVEVSALQDVDVRLERGDGYLVSLVVIDAEGEEHEAVMNGPAFLAAVRGIVEHGAR